MKSIYAFFGRFRLKLMLIFVSAMLAVCAASGLFVHHYVSDYMFARLRGNLISVAQIAGAEVDASELLTIPLAPEGTASPAHKKIEKTLGRLKEAVPSVRYMYILKKDAAMGDRLKFVVDIDTEESAALPGDEYDASDMPEL